MLQSMGLQRVRHDLMTELKIEGNWNGSYASPGGSVVKNPPANAGDGREPVSIPELGRSPGVRNGNQHQLSLPIKFHEQRSLAVYCP